MAIKQVLELIGSDVVIKQLDAVQKKGEESLAAFNKPLPELKFPELKPPDPKGIEEFSSSTIKLKDALHILRPILQTAGVQVGEFGAFARLASGSVVGLGAALAGAVVLGLAKLEENAARTKATLGDLFGSGEQGEKAFAALEKQAKQFGTTVDSLAPGIEAFQIALNKVDRTAKGFVAIKAEDLPGAQIAKNATVLTEAYSNFLKLLRAGRLTQDEAEKSAKAFFDAIKDGGVIASQALKNLPAGTVNELAKALGAAGLTTQSFFKAVDAGQLTIDKLQQALSQFGPQAQKAFDLKAIKTFGDEIGKLLATIQKGFSELTGKAFSEFVIGELSRVRQGIQDTLDELFLIKAAIDAGARALKIPGLGRTFVGPTLEQARLPAGPEGGLALGMFPTPEQAGKAGSDAADGFKQGFMKQGFVFPPVTGADQAGANAAAVFGKSFKDNPAFAQSMLLDKTEAEKNADEILKALEDKKPKPFFTFPTIDDTAISKPLEDATSAAKTAFDKFIEGIKNKWNELNELKPPDFPITAGPGRGPLAAMPGLSIFQSLFGGGQGGPTPETLTAPFQQASDQIRQIWSQLMEFISTSISTIDLSGATQALVSPFQVAVPQIQQILQDVGRAVDELLKKLQQAGSAASQLGAFAQGGSGGGFASGGIVRGPGSTTSDSILAFLSNKEFVVNAKAVSHYGQDFFTALNAMRLPLHVGNFNMGGLARVLGNRFVAGGPVSAAGNRSLTLVLDQKRFGLTGSKGTIDDLEREASLRGLAMIGKAPSWIR